MTNFLRSLLIKIVKLDGETWWKLMAYHDIFIHFCTISKEPKKHRFHPCGCKGKPEKNSPKNHEFYRNASLEKLYRLFNHINDSDEIRRNTKFNLGKGDTKFFFWCKKGVRLSLRQWASFKEKLVVNSWPILGLNPISPQKNKFLFLPKRCSVGINTSEIPISLLAWSTREFFESKIGASQNLEEREGVWAPPALFWVTGAFFFEAHQPLGVRLGNTQGLQGFWKN